MLPRDDRQLSWESKSAGLDSLLGTIDDVLCLFFVASASDVDCDVCFFIKSLCFTSSSTSD